MNSTRSFDNTLFFDKANASRQDGRWALHSTCAVPEATMAPYFSTRPKLHANTFRWARHSTCTVPEASTAPFFDKAKAACQYGRWARHSTCAVPVASTASSVERVNFSLPVTAFLKVQVSSRHSSFSWLKLLARTAGGLSIALVQYRKLVGGVNCQSKHVGLAFLKVHVSLIP